MKKFFFFIFSFSFLQMLVAQDTITQEGYTVFHYPNGKKSSEGQLVNGQPDGWWRSYHDNGKLSSEGNRKYFQLDSLWIFYDKNGKKTLEINYKDGKKQGKRVQYLKEEFVVDEWINDSIIGNVITYYSDSSIKKITPYSEGKPHGLEKELNREGRITSVTSYYRGTMTRREFINRIDNFGYKQGNWKFFWDNGNLKEEGSFQNDKKHGFFKYYDTTGQFLSVEKWENNQLITDAPETKVLDKKMNYHPNGKPAITATFFKGVPEGIRREYDTTGKIIKGYVYSNGWMRFEGITDDNGLRQGLWKEYYPTGELRSEGHYQNSKLVGKWKFLFQDGNLEISGQYDSKGKKDGEWIWYYPNRSSLRIEHYNAGSLEGEYVEYNEEGLEIAKGEFEADEEQGNWIYNYQGMIEKGSFEEGKRYGPWKLWYSNGQLASEIEYDMDIPGGKYITFWENGKIKLSGKYEAGEKNGLWYQYDENGNLILTTLYKNGIELMWNTYTIEP